MKKIIPFICLLVTFATLLISCTGCTNPETTTTPPVATKPPIKQYTDSSATIGVTIGEQFEIDLEGNPTTGYTWQGNEVYDKTMLDLFKKEYLPSRPQMIGSGGAQLYLFKALKAGDTQIKMTYKRSWETTDYDKTVIFNVTIK